MKTPLGKEVDLGAGHIVLDGVPAIRETGTAAPPHLFGPCLLWPRSLISATAELLQKYVGGLLWRYRIRAVLSLASHLGEFALLETGPYSPLCANMTSSTKPEVHNILHCRQRRTEPRPRLLCTENFAKSGRAFFIRLEARLQPNIGFTLRARSKGVHAFGYNSTESKLIWMKSGAL